MPFPLHLRITPDADGSWRVELGHRDLRPVTGTLAAAEVAALVRDVPLMLEPDDAPVVVVRGADADLTRAEENVGRRLSKVLTATPDIAASLAWQLGAAKERRELVVLVVDSEIPEVRGLPWELLAGPGGAMLEAGQEALVARMTPGRPASEPPDEASQLELLVWCPAPDDPVSARLLSYLDAMCSQLGLPAPRRISPDQPPPPREEGTARVLHVIAHGRKAQKQIELLVGEEGERVSAGTALHVLAPVLRDVELTVLHVCEGGVDLPVEIDGLVARFIRAGAPACVAPTTRLSLDASQAFLRALYPSLVSGGSLADAVASGRRAARALAIPHADSRWYNQVLFVGDMRVVAKPSVVHERWLPDGWPRPAPDAASLLDEAFRIACRTGSGFVGLEHLALALSRMPLGAAGLERVRFQLGLRRDEFLQYLSNFMPVSARKADWGGTLRLRGYGAALRPGFGLVELWDVITRDRTHFLREMVRGRLIGPSTLDSLHSDRTEHSMDWTIDMKPPKPVNALQVLGGPEDGRVLRMTEGEVIGRWSEAVDSDYTLYCESILVDRRLSRRHVRWLGEGRIELLKRARALIRRGFRDPEPLAPKTVLRLEEGDVLQLSRATWLRAMIAE
ncbi:MAG: CHAT domain-containing protein [Alphaproteobacteria bacterium]|nr:CHAT domain-containing protein [Alphaproteobacteria bacterium]MCB9791197.1 CHAT domain-containing protein [Alphaproteobacteria bacterium]